MTPKALGNKILVLENEPRAQTLSGITVPMAWRKKSYTGWVVSAGPKVREKIPELTERMFIVFRAYAGTEIEWRGHKFRLLTPDEVIGMIPKPSVDQVTVQT
jgi:co-chaperonin GroES (HSP10)